MLKKLTNLTSNFMCNCISIAILCATHHCLRGSIFPLAIWVLLVLNGWMVQALACTLSNSSSLFPLLLPPSSLLLASFLPSSFACILLSFPSSLLYSHLYLFCMVALASAGPPSLSSLPKLSSIFFCEKRCDSKVLLMVTDDYPC